MPEDAEARLDGPSLCSICALWRLEVMNATILNYNRTLIGSFCKYSSHLVARSNTSSPTPTLVSAYLADSLKGRLEGTFGGGAQPSRPHPKFIISPTASA